MKLSNNYSTGPRSSAANLKSRSKWHLSLMLRARVGPFLFYCKMCWRFDSLARHHLQRLALKSILLYQLARMKSLSYSRACLLLRLLLSSNYIPKSLRVTPVSLELHFVGNAMWQRPFSAREEFCFCSFKVCRSSFSIQIWANVFPFFRTPFRESELCFLESINSVQGKGVETIRLVTVKSEKEDTHDSHSTFSYSCLLFLFFVTKSFLLTLFPFVFVQQPTTRAAAMSRNSPSSYRRASRVYHGPNIWPRRDIAGTQTRSVCVCILM